MRFLPHLAAAILFTMAGRVQAAAIVDAVKIEGLDPEDPRQALMIENINAALSLHDSLGQRLGESRFEYLAKESVNEAREALEPFGYYSPGITLEFPPRPVRTEDGASATAGEEPVGPQAPTIAERRERRPADHLTVTLRVRLGEPVKVRNSSIAIEGAGGDDRYLKEDLAAFAPQSGAVFDHTTYEASKLKIVRRLAERGYLDADFLQRRVEVTRAEHAADIDLSWVSGIRYDMGPVTFHQEQFRPGLLDQLVYWEEGSYFHQGKLDRLRQSLSRLDYFNTIDIEPDPDRAVDGRVPIDVNLTLAKRDIYTAGVSYGTESGAGIRLGLDRRYVNDRGHKASVLLDYAQKRKSLTAAYRIPAFKWLDGWYTAAVQAYDEQTDYIDTRLLRLTASRSGEINEHLTATASLNALRERWTYTVVDGGGGVAPLPYRYATFTYPEISAEYVDVDDRLFPRRGASGSLTLRGGVEGAGSDVNFAQLHARARWFRGLGESNRLILRGELGHTFTDALADMPPSLRFFAGGDRSIRGYQYREVGPRVVTGGGEFSVGAKNVVTASAEYEHYLNASWGVAGFIDGGSAFDGTDLDWRTGVGVGARWRSPVGLVRVDIAHGLDDPDSSFTIGLGIGAEF
ncbi:MAG TPA: autotransporter assembly complex family protein [Pseudoxanthomonas sp.]